MWKILSPSQMAALDKKAIEEFHYPSALLMENAGIKAWLYLDSLLKEKQIRGPYLFIGGKGNNGGDALVMARQCYLQGKEDLFVILSDIPKEGGDPHIMYNLCLSLGIQVLVWPEQTALCEDLLSRAAVIVDGISGTGIKGALRSPLSNMVSAINRSPAFVASIDIPSGLGEEYNPADEAVQADLTLTIGLPKTCLYFPHNIEKCGDIKVVPIGFPPVLVNDPAIKGELLEDSDISLIPGPGKTTYKNKRGHLAVFAGSMGTHGAAVLSANGAARSRAGLVSLFTGYDVYTMVASQLVSAMTKAFDWIDEDPSDFDDSKYRAIVFGPGVGLQPYKKRWLKHLIGLSKPLVIDADGITLAGELVTDEKLSFENVIFTPHPGEFRRLSGISKSRFESDTFGEALDFSAAAGAVIVLKGHVTYIAAPDGRFRIYPGMNPALATGGSGDVLAGIIGALLVSGMGLFDAASLGVVLHGAAGKECFRRKGWFIAEDLPETVSRIMAALEI